MEVVMRTLEEIDRDIAVLKTEREQRVQWEMSLQLEVHRKIVPDVDWHELTVQGYRVKGFPHPFWFQDVARTITNIRRNDDGVIEFQLGDLDGVPVNNGDDWVEADALDD